MESPSIEIRPAERADLPAILALLRQDSFEEHAPGNDPSPAQVAAFETIAAMPDQEIVVGTLAGEVVATLQLTFLPGLAFDGAWRAQLEAVRVRDDLRGKRIGTCLMAWVLDRARARGCNLVQLTSNRARVDAHRFYERLGFKASHVGMKIYL